MEEHNFQTQEDVVFSIVALASLFYNTVESFGNIHSSLYDSKDESILLAQLGIEQARLMIWGDRVGILSPPSSVADQAGALKPVMTEEGVARPLYSRQRDERLDNDEMRHNIEGILSALSYTLSPPNYDIRLDVNGLKPWQQGYSHPLEQPAVNQDRLSRLEERFSLLLDTASAKSGMARPTRHATTQWLVSDLIRFSNFVKFTKLHVDKLIESISSLEEIEEVLKNDIRLLGEPAGANQKRAAKLNILIKACKGRYPFLGLEAKAALQKLHAELGEPEHHHGKMPKFSMPKIGSNPNSNPGSRPASRPASPDGKRPGLLSRLSTYRKSRPGTPAASRPGSPDLTSRNTSFNASVATSANPSRKGSIA